MGYLPHFRP